MRQKLEKKKDNTKPEEEETPITLSSGKADQPTVEKLLEFIEGPQEEPPKLSARAAKRQRRKQRKVWFACVCVCCVYIRAYVCVCMHAFTWWSVKVFIYVCTYVHTYAVCVGEHQTCVMLDVSERSCCNVESTDLTIMCKNTTMDETSMKKAF